PTNLSGTTTLQRVEADPESVPMGVIHECLEAMPIGRCPAAGGDLAAFLDLRPGVVPPSAIVRGPLCQQLLRRQRGGKMGSLAVGVSRKFPGVGGTKHAQSCADGDSLEKHILLRVRILGQDQERFWIERRKFVRI